MRRKFDQYVNLRPAYLFAGVPCPLEDKAPGSIDMLVYRENTEGEYAPVGGQLYPGTEHEIAMQTGVFTRRGCERIIRAAFDAARKRPRRRLTSITKSNAQVYGMGLWDDGVRGGARRSTRTCRSASLLVDAAAMDFVRKPEAFDVVVASNLFGDILTDLSRGRDRQHRPGGRARTSTRRRSSRACSSRSTAAPRTSPGRGSPTRWRRSCRPALMLDHLGLAKSGRGGPRRGGEGAGARGR